MAQSWDELLDEYAREDWEIQWLRDNPGLTRLQLIGLENRKQLILRHLHSIKCGISRTEGDTSTGCLALNNLFREIEDLNFSLWPDFLYVNAPQAQI